MQHQKLLHVVAESPWSDERVLAKVREQVVPSMTQRGPIEAWIMDAGYGNNSMLRQALTGLGLPT